MPAGFIVPGESSAAKFTLTLYRGEGMVMAAMNWKVGKPPRDFGPNESPWWDRFYSDERAKRDRLAFA